MALIAGMAPDNMKSKNRTRVVRLMSETHNHNTIRELATYHIVIF